MTDAPTAPVGLSLLLVNARTAAACCGVSRASWDRLNASGRIPSPIHLGGSVRWRVDDLKSWTAWGCPNRAEFEARLAAEGQR